MEELSEEDMEVVNVSSYPLLSHFGSMCGRLSREEAEYADFDKRFASIGRFVVGQSIRFYSVTLSREGRVSYDPEDIFMELWAELRHRDGKYNAVLGEYLTFAQRVVRNKLSELLECTHCVESPANAGEKYKELLAKADVAELEPREQKRLSALIAANVDHAPLGGSDSIEDRVSRPEEEAIKNERRKLSEDAITKCLSKLSARESLAIGYAFGLWSREKMSMAALDGLFDMAPGTFSRALITAKRKLRTACSQLRLRSSWL
jgi:hypothetical protein